MTTRRRTSGLLSVAALVVGALAACGAQPGDGSAGATTSTPSSATSGSGSTTGSRAADPIGLVGLWAVESATGRPAGERSVLRLAAGDLSWWRDCGVAFGSWRAGAGLLLLDAGRSTVGSCPDPAGTDGPGSTTTSWLTRTARFERDGDGWRLLDAFGRAQARLRPGATLAPRTDVDPSLATRPTPDAAARAALAEPASLPQGLSPASPATTMGRWTLAPSASRTPARPSSGGKPPFVAVAGDGTWTGWDGCNGASGRWRVGDGGRLLVTSGPRTLIACEGIDLPGLWASAARVGLVDRQLVLVGPDGRELARLTGPRAVASITHGPVQR